MKLHLIILLSLFFSNFSFSQNEQTTEQDSTWMIFKNAAHQIGFCIFHPSQNHCTDHSDEFAKRDKTTPPDHDTYYFEMKKKWAQNRLQVWEKRQEQPANDFLILFDIAQEFSLNTLKDKTINSYMGFVIIDLTDTIDFILNKKNQNELVMNIQSDEENAMMENTLWREFMSGRLGRFSQKIDFKLIGKNAESYFEEFKKAFFIFQKEINK